MLFRSVSDGTGEDDAIKAKRTDLICTDGTIPSFLVMEKIEYDVSGMRVVVSYNNVNDEIGRASCRERG